MLDKVKVVTGDGRVNFSEKIAGDFDAIHVGAAAPEIPKYLIESLATNGRMIIPVGPEGHDQVYQQIDKDKNGKITITDLMGVIYVPLTDKDHQLQNS